MAPIPPDGRGGAEIEILHGLGTTAYRLEYDIKDINVATPFRPDVVTVGDFLRLIPGSVTNGDNDAAFTCSDTAMGIVGARFGLANTNEDSPLGIAWNAYDDDNVTGDPDANDRDALTVLTGEMIVKLKQSKFAVDWAGNALAIDAVINYAEGTTGGGDWGLMEVGREILLMNEVLAGVSSDKLITMPLDLTEKFTATVTNAEVAIANAVIGKIIEIPDTTYVICRFSF